MEIDKTQNRMVVCWNLNSPEENLRFQQCWMLYTWENLWYSMEIIVWTLFSEHGNLSVCLCCPETSGTENGIWAFTFLNLLFPHGRHLWFWCHWLQERPKWMKISSLDELKTKVGHVIVMILLVKMFERSKMVTIATGLDLLSYSVCIFLSSASLYILHNLHRPEQEHKVV